MEESKIKNYLDLQIAQPEKNLKRTETKTKKKHKQKIFKLDAYKYKQI